MIRTHYFAALAATALMVCPATAYAAEGMSKDQSAVWSAVEAQWAATKAKDANWADRMLADGFYGWSNSLPAPRSKASEAAWTRFGMEEGTALMQELHPMQVVVSGNTAIAHYYYVQTNQSKDGKRKQETGRWTDVLVRDGGGWKFIGWNGGADSED